MEYLFSSEAQASLGTTATTNTYNRHKHLESGIYTQFEKLFDRRVRDGERRKDREREVQREER
jgi:hypothetical protein